MKDISYLNWDEGVEMYDVNEVESFLTSNIKKAFDRHALIDCMCIQKRKPPWRTEQKKSLTRGKIRLKN